MLNIPYELKSKGINTVDIICAGTPCQAFSYAGYKKGLLDDRGNLTLKLVDIVNKNDELRELQGKSQSILFWENVEGVLSDKSNVFGSFISALVGLDKELRCKSWSKAGLLRGPKRNVAWRVLDAKSFGVPQQRKRVYLVATGTNYFPENILFEIGKGNSLDYENMPLCYSIANHSFETFRQYTDCLYSAYGTKWNGNAAAYNGSLFVMQDERLRRFSPLECERLMGFPDHYTDIKGATTTARYQALGNSWAIPVVRWVGSQIYNHFKDEKSIFSDILLGMCVNTGVESLYSFKAQNFDFKTSKTINCSEYKSSIKMGDIGQILVPIPIESNLFLSKKSCIGILNRASKTNKKINDRLKEEMLKIISE